VSHLVSECIALAQKHSISHGDGHDPLGSAGNVALKGQKTGFTTNLIQSVILRRPNCYLITILRSKQTITLNTTSPILIRRIRIRCIIFDVAGPFETSIVSKERGKIDNYCGKTHTRSNQFGTAVHFKSVPIVFGALGTVSKGQRKDLKCGQFSYNE